MANLVGKKSKGLIGAFLVLLATGAVCAQSQTAEQALREKTRDVMLLMTNVQFVAADRAFLALKVEYPDAPHLRFLEAYKCFWRYYLSGDDGSQAAEFTASTRELISAASAKGARYEEDRLLFLACGHFFMAVIHKGEGRSAAALIDIAAMVSTAKELERRYPNLSDRKFVTGAIAVHSGKFPASTADLEEAADSAYYSAPIAEFVLAEALEGVNKDLEAALPHCKALADKYPGNALFHFHLAKVYQRTGRTTESLEAYREVVSLLGVYPPADSLLYQTHFAEGQILERQRKFDAALAEYEQVFQWADETDGKAAWFISTSHLQIAKCLVMAGEQEKALGHLKSVKKEDNPDAYRQAESLAREIQERERTGGR